LLIGLAPAVAHGADRPDWAFPVADYSDADKNSGIVWGEATFEQYIADPRAMIPGTRMPFAGLKDPQQINDLWAYLTQFNADGGIKK
jgi:cytochrome c